MLAAHFNEPEETAMHKIERFEQEVKKRFIDEPGQMKLLIVVDKLLTGFDAPSATYLYIDKQMQDHGLFQAICRVNRLDGEDKEYGYIIDYKDLFRSLERSIEDYTGEAFDGYDKADVEGLLKDRLQQGRERLEETREATKALCEPVEPPHDTAAYLHYFCAAYSGNVGQLKNNEPKRVAFYKQVAAFLRAYANLANEMSEASYSEAEAQEIKAEGGSLREGAPGDQTGQRRLHRPEDVRASHAAPARYVHPRRRERAAIGIRRFDARATDCRARGRRRSRNCPKVSARAARRWLRRLKTTSGGSSSTRRESTPGTTRTCRSCWKP